MTAVGFFGQIQIFLQNVVGTFTSVISYITEGISTLLSVPGIFPSIWSVFPGAITSVFFALLICTCFVSVLLAVLRR